MKVCVKSTLFLLITAGSLKAFNGTIRFSDRFYAAQKYFYREARAKYPKIASDHSFPEVPVKGKVSPDELRKIIPLTDQFAARNAIIEEFSSYPEQTYPELFSFLHSAGRKTIRPDERQKWDAVEFYFSPWVFLLSGDKTYTPDKELLLPHIPLVLNTRDRKSFSLQVYNTSRRNYMVNVTGQETILLQDNKPVMVKTGENAALRLVVNAGTRKDSTFRTVLLQLVDPVYPRMKLSLPVVLIPSAEFLNLPPHFYQLSYSYSSFFNHINQQSDNTVTAEDCVNGGCSAEKSYSVRNHNRLVSEYFFGNHCTVQYNVLASHTSYNSSLNKFQYSLNEYGTISGADRNCVSATGQIIPCPPGTPDNGKELFGSRKITFRIFVPRGPGCRLRYTLAWSDLSSQPETKRELSWLGDKKLVVVITRSNEKTLIKEVLVKNPFSPAERILEPGTYTVSVYPSMADGEKYIPSFHLKHLNHQATCRFDFLLQGFFTLNTIRKK